jgi:hypothetical protein
MALVALVRTVFGHCLLSNENLSAEKASPGDFHVEWHVYGLRSCVPMVSESSLLLLFVAKTRLQQNLFVAQAYFFIWATRWHQN